MIYIPNWFVHTKWAKKAGIETEIANRVNRSIDYGFNWNSFDEKKENYTSENENVIFKQLLYYYEKTKNPKEYIKACYLHYLLDFFKETYLDIKDLNLIFNEFLRSKAISKIIDSEGKHVDFKPIILEIFQLIRENSDSLYKDLKGPYLSKFSGD